VGLFLNKITSLFASKIIINKGLVEMDVKKIREDFPILDSRGIIYFDNAATSQKPVQVVNAVRNFYEYSNSNVHRGVHKLSLEASKLYEEAHEVVSKFIKARGVEEIIFTSGTTHSLNLVAYMLGLRLSRGDNVVVSIMEHHSNLLPWVYLSKLRGFEVRVVGLGPDYDLNYDELANLVDNRTRVVAITHVSNVLGTVVDVRRVSKIAHENNALVVVDGAQSVPHMPIDVKELDADFLAFSGHKMLGPTGIGVLYFRKELQEEFKTPFTGGGIVEEVRYRNGEFLVKLLEPPWSFEAGTPHIAGAIGLAEAAKYLMSVGMSEVEDHEKRLASYLISKIRSDPHLNEELVIYGPSDLRKRGGIVSFNFGNSNPNLVASFLDAYNVAVRSGYHCAQPLHDYIGASLGSVRASFYLYNTQEEVDVMIEALNEYAKLTRQS
jgi:cysteine desulfurase/selenocysteine lyase